MQKNSRLKVHQIVNVFYVRFVSLKAVTRASRSGRPGFFIFLWVAALSPGLEIELNGIDGVLPCHIRRRSH